MRGASSRPLRDGAPGMVHERLTRRGSGGEAAGCGANPCRPSSEKRTAPTRQRRGRSNEKALSAPHNRTVPRLPAGSQPGTDGFRERSALTRRLPPGSRGHGSQTGRAGGTRRGARRERTRGALGTGGGTAATTARCRPKASRSCITDALTAPRTGACATAGATQTGRGGWVAAARASRIIHAGRGGGAVRHWVPGGAARPVREDGRRTRRHRRGVARNGASGGAPGGAPRAARSSGAAGRGGSEPCQRSNNRVSAMARMVADSGPEGGGCQK